MRLLAKRSARGGLALVIGVGLLICGGLWMLPRRSAPDMALTTAKARWAARGFASYRLVVREETRGGGCQQDVTIDHEQIRSVALNRCVHIPSWTVSNLFTWFERLEPYASRCYPTPVACVCHMIYTTHASYDAELGYPERVTYAWRLQTNWGYRGHWERIWQTGELPSCDHVARFASGYITITVVSLTPLP
jgi:hypothetical protein